MREFSALFYLSEIITGQKCLWAGLHKKKTEWLYLCLLLCPYVLSSPANDVTRGVPFPNKDFNPSHALF